MTHYQTIFSEATGITDAATLDQIEDVVRNTIFHSTLDWQTREELENAARESIPVINELRAMGLFEGGQI